MSVKVIRVISRGRIVVFVVVSEFDIENTVALVCGVCADLFVVTKKNLSQIACVGDVTEKLKLAQIGRAHV